MNEPFPFFPKEETTYGDGYHQDMPWGYWFVSAGETPGAPPIKDECGNVYASVREAFWVGRMGMSNTFDHTRDEELEFMLSYLAVLADRFVGREERAYNFFNGSGHGRRCYESMMFEKGLIDKNEKPTPEGKAVLTMLMATRSHYNADKNVGLDWITATNGLGHGQERLDAAAMAEERERAASRMAYRFQRSALNGEPMVTLVGALITAEIPLRSTLWSMSFPRDLYARDRFYLWLCKRIDQWDAWGKIAIEHGARALSENLMRLAFCDRFADLD